MQASDASPRPRTSSQQEATFVRLLNSLRTALYSLLWPFVGLARLLLTGRSSGTDDYDGLSAAVTAKASQNFVAYLRSFHPGGGGAIGANGNGGNTNGANNQSHQAWLTTGFAAAQEQSTQQQSILLVYLHSPLHRSSETFCKQVLCHDSMTAFINQPNITAFGVSIHTAQGAYLAQLLQATSYPFLALLQPRLNLSTSTTSSNSSSSSSTMSMVLRAEGPALTELSTLQILSHFQTALQRHQATVAEAEARRLQRQEESELRQQQDAEYQAALIADQERERMKREEADQEANRLQEIQQEEERQQAEAAAQLKNAREQVPAEPKTGTSDPVTAIRFILPSGAKLNRKFYSEEKISGLIAFLIVHFHDNDINISKNIGISSNYPKKSYQDDPGLTLEEAGLASQAVLMVQDLDA